MGIKARSTALQGGGGQVRTASLGRSEPGPQPRVLDWLAAGGRAQMVACRPFGTLFWPQEPGPVCLMSMDAGWPRRPLPGIPTSWAKAGGATGRLQKAAGHWWAGALLSLEVCTDSSSPVQETGGQLGDC